MKSPNRDGALIPLNFPAKGVGKRFRAGLGFVQKGLLLSFLAIACKEELPPLSPTTEKKEESPVLRANRMTEWVMKTYDSLEKGFAKAESELLKENPNIEQVLNEVEFLIIGKSDEAAQKRKELGSIKKELMSLQEEMIQWSLTASSERKLFKEKISEVKNILDGKIKDIEDYDLPMFEKLTEDFQERLDAWKIALVSFRNASSANAGMKVARLTSEFFNNELRLAIIMRKAEWGDIESQFNLGLIHEKGVRVIKNDKTAIKWYLEAKKDGNFETRAQAHIWRIHEEKGNSELANKMLNFSGKFPEVILQLSNDAERMVLLTDFLRYGSLHLSLSIEKNKIGKALENSNDIISERSSLERKLRETKAKISRNLKFLKNIPQSSGGSPSPWTSYDSNGSNIDQLGFVSVDEQSCHDSLTQSMTELIALYKKWNSPVMQMRRRQLDYLVRAEGWETESQLFLDGDPSAKEASKKRYNIFKKHMQDTKAISESLDKFLSGVRHTIESINLLILDTGFPSLNFKTNLNWFPTIHQIDENSGYEKSSKIRFSMDNASKDLIGPELLELKKLISEHVALFVKKNGMSQRVFSLCIPDQFQADLASERFSDIELNNLMNLSALLEQSSLEFTTSILYCMLSDDMHPTLLELANMSSEGEVFLAGTGHGIINRAQSTMHEKSRSTWVKNHGLFSQLITNTEKLRMSLHDAFKGISSIAEKDLSKDPIETMWQLNQVFERFFKNWNQYGCPPIKFSSLNPLTSDPKGNDPRSTHISSKRLARIACTYRRAKLLSATNPSQFVRFMKFASYHYLSEWSVAAKIDNQDAILLLAACYHNGLARPQSTVFSNLLLKVASELK